MKPELKVVACCVGVVSVIGVKRVGVGDARRRAYDNTFAAEYRIHGSLPVQVGEGSFNNNITKHCKSPRPRRANDKISLR